MKTHLHHHHHRTSQRKRQQKQLQRRPPRRHNNKPWAKATVPGPAACRTRLRVVCDGARAATLGPPELRAPGQGRRAGRAGRDGRHG